MSSPAPADAEYSAYVKAVVAASLPLSKKTIAELRELLNLMSVLGCCCASYVKSQTRYWRLILMQPTNRMTNHS